MALNTQLTEGRVPSPIEGEVFLLVRGEIGFTAELVEDEGRVFKGDGVVHVTTLRVIFVRTSTPLSSCDNFESFDMPIARMRNESFNQPIFGANNLTIDIDKFKIGPSKVVIRFNGGGSGSFLKVLGTLLHLHRKHMMERDSPAVRLAERGDLARKAFVDPSDPSKIYVCQPRRCARGGSGVGAEVEMTRIGKKDEEMNSSATRDSSSSCSTNRPDDSARVSSVLRSSVAEGASSQYGSYLRRRRKPRGS